VHPRQHKIPPGIDRSHRMRLRCLRPHSLEGWAAALARVSAA
jgi:hypothetical protein